MHYIITPWGVFYLDPATVAAIYAKAAEMEAAVEHLERCLAKS